MEKPEGGSTISCPDSGAWLELAAGLAAPAVRDGLLQHAAECAACAAALKNALRVMESESSPEEDAMLQTLQSSKPEWQKWTAADLARRARKEREDAAARRLSSWRDRRWLAAAAVVLAAGVGYWNWRERQPPLTLLARAYTEQRTIELRIPGAAYGPMRVERGASADRPAELSESEAAIRRRLDAKPEDADWLRAKGRAELLEWRYQDAIKALGLANDVDIGASSRTRAETLTDLGTAYFERAEKENRPIDYSMAAEQLGKAIQADGSLAAAFYNRAIVYERMFLYPNAVEDWQRYLHLDPHGLWADEAARKLKALQEKMRAAAPSPERLADLAEVQLDNAMRGGLRGAGVRETAALLRDRNGDRWLADALDAGPSELTDALSRMMESRSTNRIDLFPAEVARLRGIALGDTPPAHRIWLEYEKLWRMSHSPDVAKYANSFDAALSECQRRHYYWFATELLLERSSCQWAAGDRSTASLREAKRFAAAYGLPIVGLRTAGFLSDRAVNEGLYRDAANLVSQGLQAIWSRPFPVARRLEFYNQSERLNESLGRWHAAMAAAQRAAETAQSLGITANEAILRARWAADAERSNSPKEAANQYGRAMALFETLQPGPATDEYRAAAESATIDFGPMSVPHLQPVTRNSTNPFVVAPYLRARAAFEERNGNRRGAQTLLEDAIGRIENRALAVSRDESQRWRIEMQRDYRELVWVQAQQGEVEEAYRTWQRFLRADAEIRGLRTAPGDAAATGGPAILVTFARLRSRYGVWRNAGGKVEFHWASETADSIDALARRYAALCAQPRATWETARRSGERLGAILFGNSLQSVAKDDILLLQPDSDLARVPWASIPLASGEILGERFLVAVVPGQATDEAVARLASVSVRRALAVGATQIHSKWEAEYLPLPGIHEEMAAVEAALPDVFTLEGASATASNIGQALQDADVLHFAGHASISADGIRLLVAPDIHSKDSAERDGVWGPAIGDGTRLNLAVLSACSTARYEEEDTTEPNDLARVLLFGGARQVVAALWNTDSAASSRFIQVFYANLGRGRTAVQAVRDGLSDVRRRPDWDNPYYWAQFTLFVQI